MAKDVATDAFMQNIYTAYATMNVGDFRNFCNTSILSLSGDMGKKQGFIHDLKSVNSKDRMVKKITDFVMSGWGLKVI